MKVLCYNFLSTMINTNTRKPQIQCPDGLPRNQGEHEGLHSRETKDRTE